MDPNALLSEIESKILSLDLLCGRNPPQSSTRVCLSTSSPSPLASGTDAPDNERPKKAIRVGVLQEIPRLQVPRLQELRVQRVLQVFIKTNKTSKKTDYAGDLLSFRDQHFAFRCDPRRMNLASPKTRRRQEHL
ncbi:hypothetical protein SCHPADRAFT_884694 [Schizopora paradoxa]|uniref:Uncharacterized protein n=1 Tax=Schizopora paradoxa TaxID=27342 RepID=A0A0H2S8W9_9AGAM|nr:hypothetical protein SCHPADRAFT_884694 [Schizopora paradoxa]